jgi:hypothetical protein
MWYKIAAAHLTGDEQKNAVDGLNRVARGMASAQIAEAKRLARQCQTQQFKGC